MKIVSRQIEIKKLDKTFTSKKPEFIAVYGRRRVGKTFLVRSFFEKKKCIFFSVTGSKDGAYLDQRTHFTQRIGEVFLGGIIPAVSANWDQTFKQLTDAINNTDKNKKIVIFLDELPWMATKKSKLLQTIDYYWNQYWSRDSRIKLIICGSSASWIIDNIINNKGGLHNRVTETLYLQPYNLLETEQYLLSNKVKLNRKQIVEIYMLTGGVPFYLSKIEPGFSAVQIIERLAFSENAFLLGEFDNLFSSLFDDGDAYIEIIKTIAKNREGIGQEALFNDLSKTSKGKTGLRRLKALEDAGFISSFTPHFHKKRGIYYRITDEYTLFYLQWISPLKRTKMIHALQKGYWKTLTQKPEWFSWSGYAFEAVCYKHLNQIRRSLNLSSTAIPNVWRHTPIKKSAEKGAQIDLLFDRDDNSITICEIKYTDKPFVITKEYAQKLNQKTSVFKEITATNKQIFVAIISANGIKPNSYSREYIDGVVELNDLFLGEK